MCCWVLSVRACGGCAGAAVSQGCDSHDFETSQYAVLAGLERLCIRFAQTDARVLLGAAWAALQRLRELDLAYAAELRQEGGPGGGPLAAILPTLRSLSLQARLAIPVVTPLTQQPLYGSR